MSALQRLGLVCWWAGALAGGAMALSGFGCLFLVQAGDRLGLGFGLMAFGALIALPAWALAFVLAGSFWRPPK